MAISSPFTPLHPTDSITVVRLGGFIFNAENLAISAGRVFVTGSKGVYEVMLGAGDARLSEIPIRVGIQSDHWLRNGIASDGRRLYLACADVHCPALPILAGWSENAPDIRQTLAGLGKLIVMGLLFGADSYVVAADLAPSASGAPIAFTEVIASSRGAFFANGLDVADDGSIYVANEHPGTTGGIYRIHPGGSTLELYHRCFGCTPNGVRVRGTQLYFSGLQTWPYPAAVLREVDLAGGSPKPDSSRILVVRPASVFDDFDVVDSDFVIAEFASFRHLPLGAGGLLFFSRSGEFRREIRTSELTHPSSVRVCPAGVPGLKAGDLLVAEKISHQLLALRLKGT